MKLIIEPEGLKRMLEAVIFDLDGTLLDTLDDIRRMVNKVFLAEGLGDRSHEEVRMAVGRGVDHLVTELIPHEKRSPDLVRHLAGRIGRIYQREGSVETRPYPGIAKLLRELSGAGIPMAVLTNKPHSSAIDCVQRYFPDIRFSTVRGAMKAQPIKPDPLCVEPVLEAMGSRPESTVMVGDSDVDMDTAVNAGLQPVGVSWGFRDASLLLEHGARFIIDVPGELLTLPYNIRSRQRNKMTHLTDLSER